MIEWLFAETSVPNLVWLSTIFIGAFGLFATVQITERLNRSSQKWKDIVRMIDEFHEEIEKEKEAQK